MGRVSYTEPPVGAVSAGTDLDNPLAALAGESDEVDRTNLREEGLDATAFENWLPAEVVCNVGLDSRTGINTAGTWIGLAIGPGAVPITSAAIDVAANEYLEIVGSAEFTNLPAGGATTYGVTGNFLAAIRIAQSTDGGATWVALPGTQRSIQNSHPGGMHGTLVTMASQFLVQTYQFRVEIYENSATSVRVERGALRIVKFKRHGVL